MTARRMLALLGVGIAAAQAGHLLAYELRFGAAAGQLQSAGAHAYFPTVAKTGLGLASVALVAGLFIVGAARVASSRRLAAGPRPSFVSLLAVLYTVQLGWFGVQETVEAFAGAGRPLSAPLLILWGTLGQLPVAVVAALALRWLLARVGPAFETLSAPAGAVPPAARITIALAAVAHAYAPALAWDPMASDPDRGPPSSFF